MKHDITIEMEENEYLIVLNKKIATRLTWKEILMKGADNI